MLRGKEIQTIAAHQKVRDTQIEKDYVITWLLWGISKRPRLVETLVFKGGTVLKKAWFPDYRFSEDLDFTLTDTEISNETLLHEFQESANLIEAESAIQLEIGKTEQHQSGSIAFYIYFIASLGGKIQNKSVKIDITRGEKLLFSPEKRLIFQTYPDLEKQEFSFFCYPLEEIIIEKLVALMGRTQPRDLYDVWYLLEEEQVDLDFLKLEFDTKAVHKGHKPDDFQSIFEKKERQFRASWQQYLAHQIGDLPEFDAVWRAVGRHFRRFKH